MDPWEIFEDALEAEGDRKLDLLNEAENGLMDHSRVSDCDRDVLLCSIASVRVAARVESVGEVAARASAVSSRCGSSWPLYHLAESAMVLGANEQVLRSLSEIEVGFFESRDLKWRAARCVELRIIAMINLMRGPSEVEAEVSKLAAWYVSNGDIDDFHSPRGLVVALAEAGVSYVGSLEVLSRSLDLTAWLPAELAASVENTIRRLGKSSG